MMQDRGSSRLGCVPVSRAEAPGENGSDHHPFCLCAARAPLPLCRGMSRSQGSQDSRSTEENMTHSLQAPYCGVPAHQRWPVRILSRLRQLSHRGERPKAHHVSLYEIICISYRPSSLAHSFALSFLLELSKSSDTLCCCCERDSDAMERSSKLADLTLVSKYYPVANYSYPRNETMNKYAAHMAAPPDRSSLGSDASAPGLIDDRTDSEVSADDDYQHNNHTSDIWNSYWRPGDEKRNEHELSPRKQYPALIPSPQHRRKDFDEQSGRQSPSWPLPDGASHKPRTRQTAATYSPFPKAVPLPPRAKPASPSWENSRPQRPAHDERLLTPCLNQATSPVAAFLNSLPNYIHRIPEPEPIVPEVRTEHSSISTIAEEPERPQTSRSVATRPPTPAEMPRPKTSHSSHSSHRPPTPAEPRHVKSSRSLRPISPTDISRPKPCLANRPPTPFEAEPPNLYHSDHHFPVPDLPPGQRLNHQRSMGFLTPNGEPRSFFEDDSDGEEEEEGSKSFFRFHKRSTSDLRRRSARSTDSEAPKRRRGRTSPTPTEPPGRSSIERKRHGVDVFGRMLGRRSR